jgi:hypothetical protein
MKIASYRNAVRNWLTIIHLYFKSKNRVLNENCFHNGLAVHVSKFHALFLKTTVYASFYLQPSEDSKQPKQESSNEANNHRFVRNVRVVHSAFFSPDIYFTSAFMIISSHKKE